jgi:threonylcarbamoyladenosine tRNA methylthiotransferase MtaB
MAERPVTVALPTLGCKANRYDSDTLARALAARGYTIVPAGAPADIYIVNTCTVTGEADSKSRKALRRTLKLNADALLVVTGCYASLEPARLAAIDGVDAVVPLTEQARIPDLLLSLRPPTPGAAPGLAASAARTRATVKVQDGCNLRCTFCAVTLARGPVRSRPLDDVLAELHDFAARGVPEIVLTGIRLDAYGLDLRGPRLADLVDATRALPVPRLRVSSLEPIGIDDRLIAALAGHPALCRHFHICLQSGDDGVLRAMRRGYTADRYRRLVARLRAAMPDATFTTDVIVGFPGEDDAAFARTAALVEELGFIKLHIFPFSPRPHTVAATLPAQVPDPVKAARVHALRALERRLFAAYAAPLVGTAVPVLVERTGRAGEGLTPGYLRVLAPFPAAAAGRVVAARVTAVGDDHVLAMPTA